MENVLNKKNIGGWKKKLTGAALVAVMSLSFATGAFADSLDGDKTQAHDVDVTIESGGIHLETPEINNFGSVILTPAPTTYKTSFDSGFTTKDLRGSHEGWALTVSATPFDNGTHQLPNGSLSLDGVVNIDRVGIGSGGEPISELTSTAIIDGGTVLVASADEGAGMGVFDLTFGADALGLTVDATTAKTGTYTSTLTWTLESTPSAD